MGSDQPDSKKDVSRARISLLRAGRGNFPKTRSRFFEGVWRVFEAFLVTNRLQPFSGLRAGALRLFGAKIGPNVILRPGMKVRSPWGLEIGSSSWIGEDVWFDNHGSISIGSDVAISQGGYITTGSHLYRTNMDLVLRPVVIEDGAWIAARCTILQGTVIGQNTVVGAGSVVHGVLKGACVYSGNPAQLVRPRWADDSRDLL